MKPLIVAALSLFLFCSVLHPQLKAFGWENDFSYMEFVSNATELPLEEEYDYIIVGGGTAGCPLAATLSKKYSVLLLEKGGAPQEIPGILNQEGLSDILMQADDGNTPFERFTSAEGIPNSRGRILEGSSMIGGGIHSRADEKFYEKSGVEWDMKAVENSYKWVEDSIVFRSELNEWQSVIKEALLESNVLHDNGFTLAHIVGTKITGSTFDGSRRTRGAVELLNKADNKNLRVAIRANVERIIFLSSNTGLSAAGVSYTDSAGRSHQATLRDRGEVILSAGPIGSPQLLLLSGVGPKSYLSQLRIPTVYDQPNVGHFSYDLPVNGVVIISPIPLRQSFSQVQGISEEYYIESMSVGNSSFLPGKSYPTYNNVAIMEKLPKTLSVGTLELASSTDVRVTPILRYNYYSNRLDLDHCVNGLHKIGDLLMTRSLDPYKFENMNGTRYFKFNGASLPINQTDYSSMQSFCRNTVGSSTEYHGGCSVGKVVDGDFKVFGINAFRIVDASTFTISPGTNPQATVLMLGRYVGVKILLRRMA